MTSLSLNDLPSVRKKERWGGLMWIPIKYPTFSFQLIWLMCSKKCCNFRADCLPAVQHFMTHKGPIASAKSDGAEKRCLYFKPVCYMLVFACAWLMQIVRFHYMSQDNVCETFLSSGFLHLFIKSRCGVCQKHGQYSYQGHCGLTWIEKSWFMFFFSFFLSLSHKKTDSWDT